jgi:hypothetical protein
VKSAGDAATPASGESHAPRRPRNVHRGRLERLPGRAKDGRDVRREEELCTDAWSRSRASTRPSAREVLAIIRERIIPGLKEIDGFAGFISLVDEENGRTRSVVLWETKEGAEEAERQFGAKREEIVRGAPCSRRISMKRRLWRCAPACVRRDHMGP